MAVHDVMINLDGEAVLGIYADKRIDREMLARLLLDCHVDEESYIWNNYLQAFHPDLPIADRKPEWKFLHKIPSIPAGTHVTEW